jgi:hypothetical protein
MGLHSTACQNKQIPACCSGSVTVRYASRSGHVLLPAAPQQTSLSSLWSPSSATACGHLKGTLAVGLLLVIHLPAHHSGDLHAVAVRCPTNCSAALRPTVVQGGIGSTTLHGTARSRFVCLRMSGALGPGSGSRLLCWHLSPYEAELSTCLAG